MSVIPAAPRQRLGEAEGEVGEVGRGAFAEVEPGAARGVWLEDSFGHRVGFGSPRVLPDPPQGSSAWL